MSFSAFEWQLAVLKYFLAPRGAVIVMARELLLNKKAKAEGEKREAKDEGGNPRMGWPGFYCF